MSTTRSSILLPPRLLPFWFLSFWLLPAVATATVFDDDFEINNIDMVEENFLDIKAHRFRKSLEDQWYDNTSGWRMNGASLDGDLTFLQTEIKLQQELSDSVNVRLEAEQETFYAEKDFPAPTAEVEFYPFGNDIGFSLLGTPTYEKRDIDLGGALIWGRRPWNYTRLEVRKVDALYNEKNSFDTVKQTKEPWNIKLEGAYRFSSKYKMRYRYSLGDDLQLVDTDDNSRFDHSADDYFLLFDYQPTADSVIGFTINGFKVDKSRFSTTEDSQQRLDYVSTDIYWVRGMYSDYEVRVGLQHDYLHNRIDDRIDLENDEDYRFTTLQLYSNVFHPFNEHMAWDLGLYLGDAEEKHDFTFDDTKDITNDGFQGKFRAGYIYRSLDRRNTLQFNLSLDLDEIATDGGGISFQAVF
jgi:hypothetical protein